MLLWLAMDNQESGFFIPTAVFQNHHHFGGDLPNQHESLVFWAIQIVQKGPVTPESLLQAFNSGENLPAEIRTDLREIKDALNDGEERGWFLQERGLFSLTETGENKLYALEESAIRDLENAKEAFKHLLTERFHNLTNATKNRLWEALGKFTTALAIDYFTNMGLFELPRRATLILEDVFQDVKSDLPHGHLLEIAEATYVDFLMEDPAGEVFFAAYMSSCMFAFRTSVSPEVSDGLKHEFSGKTLFLDTNILITLLGLTGEDETPASLRKMLEVAKNLGFTLRYTPFTRTEYHAAIENAGRILEGFSSTSDPEYVLRRSRPSIYREFFRQRNRGTDQGLVQGRNKKEFITFYENLKSRLKDFADLDIRLEYISEEYRKKLEESEEYQELYDNALQLPNHTSEKARHDALAVCYVKSIRDEEAEFVGIKAWFLTYHRKLSQIEPYDRRRKYPAVMPLDMWVLHFHQFIPRVENFSKFLYKTVSELLLSPFRFTPSQIEDMEPYLHVLNTREGDEVVSPGLDWISPRTVDRIRRASDGPNKKVEISEKIILRYHELQASIHASKKIGYEEAEDKANQLEEQLLLERKDARAQREKRKDYRGRIEQVRNEIEELEDGIVKAKKDNEQVTVRKARTLLSSLVIGFLMSVALFVGEWILLPGFVTKLLNSVPAIIGSVIAISANFIFDRQIQKFQTEINSKDSRLNDLRNTRNYLESQLETVGE